MGISFKNKNENIQIFLIIFSYQSMYFNSVKLHESDCKLFWGVRKVFVQLELMWEVNVISVKLEKGHCKIFTFCCQHSLTKDIIIMWI